MFPLLLTLFASLAMGTVLTWQARRVAHQWGFLDRPDQGRKRHREPIPLMGGVAVLASLLLIVAGVHLAAGAGWVDVQLKAVHGWLFLSATCCCALGMYDDRFSMRPRNKFLLQVVAALPFVLGGGVIRQCGLFGLEVDLGWWGVPVTLFWLTLCINSVNLLDGLDGVAGTVGVVVSGTVCILSLLTGHLDTALIALALCGSLLGFLVFNWHPAKIFLGDSGSLAVGFLLGALAMDGSFKTATGLTLATPLVLMSIPGFDTAMAVLRRLLSGRGIGQGDRLHLHHCLRDRGLSVVQIVLVIGLLCSGMGAAVIASTYYENDAIAMTVCTGMLAVLILGRVFGHHETRMLWQHLQHMTASSGQVARGIRMQALARRLRSQPSQSPYEAWGELCDLVEDFGGHSLEFFLQHERSAPYPILLWSVGETLNDTTTSNWEFRFVAPGDRAKRLGVLLIGKADSVMAQQSMDHWAGLIAAFCDSWPEYLLPNAAFLAAAEQPELRKAA